MEDKPPTQDPTAGDDPGIRARPQYQLRSLPLEYRWEVTRRHPYYQLYWHLAKRFHEKVLTQDEAEPFYRQAAVLYLNMIGVSGNPSPPNASFKDLAASDLNAAWLSGAVHPISCRGFAALLIASLPKEDLVPIAVALHHACLEDEPGEAPSKIKAMLGLQQAAEVGLDQFVDEPIVSINPAASGRKVGEAVAEHLKQWKEARGLSDRRIQSEKYDDYLRAFDLREGWSRGSYDRAAERTFKDVAAELGCSLSTVSTHYRAAFFLITGHAYSPSLWYEVFGLLKLSDLFGSLGKVSRRRPSKSPTRRPVPESALTGPSQVSSQGPATSRASSPSADDLNELVADILELVDKGRSDEQIVQELDLESDAIEAVAYLRRDGKLP